MKKIFIFVVAFLPMLHASALTTYYPNKYYNVDDSGKITKHIFVGDTPIATVSSAPSSSPAITYIHTDHLGGTALTTSASGTVSELVDYYPYGTSRLSETTKAPEQRKFTGHEYDVETGFTYMKARYYDARTGRFLSQDPLFWQLQPGLLVDPQQLNSYSYARNNPVRLIDATGEKVSEFQPYSSVGPKFEYNNPIGQYKGIDVLSRGDRGVTASNNQNQCVAFVNTFVKSQKAINLVGTGNALDYVSQSKVSSNFKTQNPGDPGKVQVYKNGSSVMPQENDIITWSGGSYGHVGIIAEVTFDPGSGKGSVYSVEQNYSKSKALYSQPFTRNSAGNYSVSGRGSYSVAGWTRYESKSLLPGNEKYSSYTPAPKAVKQQNQ